MRNRVSIAVLVSGALLAWLAAPAAAQKVVKIGDLGSKVGVFEGYGKYQSMAIQMAVEELNAKGGVLGHKIEVIAEDDETKPAPAVRKAEKLILQDDVKLLIGAVSSGSTMAVMDVTKKHKVIHWNSVSCAEFMRTTKFHKYYFSNQPDSRMQASGLAKYMVEKMGKKVYIFYTDYAMGQSDGRQFKTALEKLGGEVVGVAGAPLDTKDFSPWFGAITQSNPDVLFLAFAGTDSLRLMTQLHSFGMTKKYKLAGIDCFLLQQDLPAIAAPIAPPASFEMVAPPAAPAAVTAMPRATTSSTEVAASAETGSGAVSTSTTSSRVEIVMLRAIAVIMVIVMIAAFVGVITGTLTVR